MPRDELDSRVGTHVGTARAPSCGSRRRNASTQRAPAPTRHGSRIARSPPTSAIGRKVASAFERGVCREQDLAAPARAVGAVAGAVVGEPDHRSVEPVLGHRADDVRVMVLHGDAALRRAARAYMRRQVVGMQVVRDDLRP